MSDALAKSIDPEPRECTACGYSLHGIESLYCPECGHDVHSDPAFYLPSHGPTPWSRLSLTTVPRGLWWALVHPMRTFDAATSRVRVRSSAAVCFGMICIAATIALWAAFRGFGLAAAISTHLRDPSVFLRFLASEVYGPNAAAHWWRLARWEAWSIARWFVLFGLLVRLLAPKRYQIRLLLFTPWIAMLELLFLAGVWLAQPLDVVPEPSTLFTGYPDTSIWADATYAFWLKRGLLPTMLIGTVFFRAIAGWRMSRAICAGIALAPIGVLLSVIWTRIVVQFDLLF